MTLGNKIYKLRTEKNISQETLADNLGVSRQSVSKWETDQSLPEVDKIQQLCKFFNITIDSLLNQSDELEYIQIDEKYSKTNKMKRIARIFLNTGIISYILRFVVIVFVVVFHNILNFDLIQKNNLKLIIPYYSIGADLIILIITFALYKFIYTQLHENKKSIITEIVALVIMTLAPLIFNTFSSLLDNKVLMKSENYNIISLHVKLTQILSYVYLIFSIGLGLFVFGIIISLTTRKIDHQRYEFPIVRENENICLGFKILSLLMGFLGGFLVWIFTFVMFKEWRYDQPIRKRTFKTLFFLGFFLKLFILLIITTFLILISYF